MATPRSLRLPLLLLAVGITVATIASPLRAQAPQQGAPPGNGRVRVLIGFDHEPRAAEQALVRGAGGQVRYTYHLVSAMAATLPEQAVNALANAPGITAIELDGVATAYVTELDNTWGVQHIGAGNVHALDPPVTGQGVLVAVLDTGIDTSHPDLVTNYRADVSFDFVNNDAVPADGDGHGTHVSGTIAAAANGIGVIGVAPDAEIMAVKVLDDQGSGYWSDIVAGLEWAVDHGAKVTNSSFGSSSDPGTTVRNAYAAAEAAGVVNVAAAGNEGSCNGGGGGKGGAAANSVGWPARYPSVIAVAATNANDVRPCFSSIGPAVAIAAPGVNINSTVPTGTYAIFSGTSMASPHVAGVAALVISAGVPDANGDGQTADDVRRILTTTAHDLGVAGIDTSYGAGLVDAEAAVNYVLSGPIDPPPGGTIHVGGVSYSVVVTGGAGKGSGSRTLRVVVSVADGSTAAVNGATVAVNVTRGSTLVGSGSSVTGTAGTVTFEVANPSNGCYSTTVTSLTAAGLTWSPTSTPANSYCIGSTK